MIPPCDHPWWAHALLILLWIGYVVAGIIGLEAATKL